MIVFVIIYTFLVGTYLLVNKKIEKSTITAFIITDVILWLIYLIGCWL